MKKIAITTIISVNFGNRLQNYALQQTLEQMGYSAFTLRRTGKDKNIKARIKAIVQAVLQTKGAKFKQFNNNIHFANEVVTRDAYPSNIKNIYDYFIVGSDQVWNPHYNFVAGKCDFLDFANNRQKISYAASFGVSEIPDERKKEYAEYLNTFKAISVREKQGAKIVRKLTNRNAEIVLDPTMLLDAEDWKKIERKSNCKPEHKYIFVYALGEKNERFKSKIDQLCKDYDVFDIKAVQKNGKELPVGPSEFIYLLRNSEIVLTDSFHAAVFSLIFHKRFIVFNRTGLNMNSRVESLAELVDESNRINECGDFDCEKEIDYQKTDTILKRERKKSIEFLNAALSD